MIEALRFIDHQLDKARMIESEFLSQTWELDETGRVPHERVRYILKTVSERNQARNMLTCVNSVAVAVFEDQRISEEVFDRLEGGFICTFGWRWSRYIATRRLDLGFERSYSDFVQLLEQMAIRRLKRTTEEDASELRAIQRTHWNQRIEWARDPSTALAEIVVKPITFSTSEPSGERAVQLMQLLIENPEHATALVRRYGDEVLR